MRYLSIKMRQVVQIALIGVLISFVSYGVGSTQAQSQSSVTLRVESPCNSENYPEVQCTVSVLDAKGVPLDKLEVSSFEVIEEENGKPSNLKLSREVNRAVKLNNMLVLDMGTTTPGITIQVLKDAAKGILQAVDDTDRVGMIGITGKVEQGNTTTPPIDRQKESDFVLAGSSRNDVINIVSALNPQPNTPLYDAICKGLKIASKETIGARAVIVVSDGIDSKSTNICPDSRNPIELARDDRTPIFTIYVGNRTNGQEYLQQLAFQSGGAYLGNAENAAAVVAKFKEIQSLLKTRYTLSFKASLPSDGREHRFTVNLTQPAGKSSDTAGYVANWPLKPNVKDVKFKNGDRELNFRNTALFGEITAIPVIEARGVTQVVYRLDNNQPVLAEKEPFEFKFQTTGLDMKVPHTLTMRIVGDKPEYVTTATVNFAVGPIPQPTVNPTAVVGGGSVEPSLPTAVPCSWWNISCYQIEPLALISFAVAGLGLIALLLLFAIMRRRNQQVGNSDFTQMDETGAGRLSDKTKEETQMQGTGDDHTKPVVRAENDHTSVFERPVAYIKFFSPPFENKQFPIGGTAGAHIKIGRDAVGASFKKGDIKFPRDYKQVSRNHAEIEVNGSELVFINKTDAENGTLLNGNTVTPNQTVRLRIGDKLELADIRAEIVK